jgi:hypothetical protein
LSFGRLNFKLSTITNLHNMAGGKLFHRYRWVLFPIFILVLNELRFQVKHERRQLGSSGTSWWPDSHSTQRGASQQQSRYAYVFLVAGCNPKNPGAYRGFLYNILVAKHILREEGSKADVVLLLRMVHNVTITSLPLEDERMLREAGIKLRYLPPPTQQETFYSAMMAKFHILNMTEYARVMYMDADVMPTCNLDYVFQLSEGENATLKENFVITWNFEPANGGLFMLQPKHGDLEALERIVAEQRASVQNQSMWPPFDVVQGWGHVIQPYDPWQTLMGGKGTNWSFTVRSSRR